MKKLEINHIAPYLPYGLMIQCKKHWLKYGETPILKMNGLAYNDGWQYEFIVDETRELRFADINAKGFLPLLTKELPDMTEFSDSDESVIKYCLANNNGLLLLHRISHKAITELIKQHFDIYGLIESGHAIDIKIRKDE